MAAVTAAAAAAAPSAGVHTHTTAGVLHSFASARLSASELAYIASGVASNLRVDGRSRLDYRPLTLQTDTLPQANGSARLKLEETDVLVAVNMSMVSPDPSRSRCEGFVHCSVDQSAACVGDEEDRIVQANNLILTAELQKLIAHSHALPLTSLVIVPEKQVWCINIDVLVIENGGNLMDAVVMAVKAALLTTKMPPIEIIAGDGGNVEIIVNDDPFSHILLPHASELPLVISLFKIGSSGEWILDASSDEEECMSMRVALAVNPQGELCGINKSGIGTINLHALENIIAHATEMGVQLNRKLMHAIQADEKRNGSKTAHK